MPLSAEELLICNRAVDRIGAGVFTLENQTTDVAGAACNRHYEKIRDSLLRSYDFNFSRARAKLSVIKTLTLNTQPKPTAWAPGDQITGLSSGATAKILEARTDSEYVIAGNLPFKDGETITHAKVEPIYRDGVEIERDNETIYWFDSSRSSQVVCKAGYPIVAIDAPDFEWTYQYLLPEDFMRLIAVYENDQQELPTNRYHIEGNRLLTHYKTVSLRYVKKVTDPTKFDPLFVEALELRLALAILPILAGTKTSSLRAELKEELMLAEGRARVISAQENNVSGYEKYNTARYKK